MASRYISYPIMQDARDLMTRAFNYIKNKIPGWQPSEGQLEVWLIEAFGSEAADIATLSTEVPKAIFRFFGATLFGIPPIDATPATVTSTWFFVDSIGHTVSAGTQVGIRDDNNNLVAFYVLNDVVVAGGNTQTTAGAVQLVATIPGATGSNIGSAGGPVELVDPLPWVDHITSSAITTGGTDAETDDQYLSRLSTELQLMAPRPILPRDFALLARNVSGVQRAAAIDGYNTADSTFGNARMVTVIPLDASGADVSVGTRAAVQAYLQSLREINFVVNVTNSTQIEVDVSTTVKVLAGYAPNDVAARVKAAVMDFLSSSKWGIESSDDPNDPRTWVNTNIIYYLELATVINNVSGVDRITALTLGLHGGAQLAQDLALNGLAPVPFTTSSDVVVATV